MEKGKLRNDEQFALLFNNAETLDRLTASRFVELTMPPL
jgi:hypothetical protein